MSRTVCGYAAVYPDDFVGEEGCRGLYALYETAEEARRVARDIGGSAFVAALHLGGELEPLAAELPAGIPRAVF